MVTAGIEPHHRLGDKCVSMHLGDDIPYVLGVAILKTSSWFVKEVIVLD